MGKDRVLKTAETTTKKRQGRTWGGTAGKKLKRKRNNAKGPNNSLLNLEKRGFEGGGWGKGGGNEFTGGVQSRRSDYDITKSITGAVRGRNGKNLGGVNGSRLHRNELAKKGARNAKK